MNKTLKVIFFVTISVTILSLFFSSDLFASDENPPSVYHVVICWLKEPNNEYQRQKLIEETKKLQSLPEILSIQVGNMIPSKRAIVDSSYDVGIVMTFKDESSMNSYLHDPLHQKTTKEILVPLTSKVVVYDFVTSK